MRGTSMTSGKESGRQNLPGLLAMRWYAALAIVLVHLIALPKLRLPGYLWFVPNYFGNGVPLFYLVSAFGLFVGYHSRLQTKDQLAEYYRRRFFRIAPLFYFMMLAYIPLGWHWGHKVPISQYLSSGLFVFNFIPQQVTGFVMASWSIGVEMAFYAILPILVFAITNLARAIAFFAVTVFVAAMWMKAFEGTSGSIAAFGNFSLVAYLPFFAAGIAGYHLWAQFKRSRPRLGAGVLIGSFLAMAGLIAFADQITSAASYFVPENIRAFQRVTWAIFLAGAVVGISLYAPPFLVGPFVRLMGEASFSIYLWHPVVIVLMHQAGTYEWLYAHLNGTSNPFFASVLATLAILLPLSVLSYRLIELPGMALANRFRRPSAIPVEQPAPAFLQELAETK